MYIDPTAGHKKNCKTVGIIECFMWSGIVKDVKKMVENENNIKKTQENQKTFDRKHTL